MQIVEHLKQRLQVIDRQLSRKSWYRIGRNSILALNQRDGQRKAAAITYFAIFSIFPLIVLMIVMLSFLIDTQEAQEQVIGFITEFLPRGEVGVRNIIESVVEQRGVAAGFGIVFLLWGALGWFESIDRAVNEIWAIESTRSFIKGKLFALGMIAALGFVMLLSWIINIALGVAMAFVINVVGAVIVLWELIVAVVTFGLIFVVFLLLYRFSPMCGLSWGDVWRGALITAVVWTLSRSFFAIYITYFADYASAYGPIAAVIVFLVWLYLAHNVILFGAALTYSTRLEAQGIHELRNLPCGTPEGNLATGERRGAS